MIEFRTFRNYDPPGLAEIWNDTFTNRGAYPLPNSTPFDRWVLSKPYFDPVGLTVALDDRTPIGFSHGGFGPTQQQDKLAYQTGVVCVVAVRPSHRRQGIGTELLRRCEEYLTAHGALLFHAGPQRPLNPFYFGLYGGSDSPGFLTSDAAAAPFFETHGYRGTGTTLVLQRRLQGSNPVADLRFNGLRRRYEMQMLPRTPLGSWWQECVLGILEPVEFRLEDRLTGLPAARAVVWDMEGFSRRWQQPAAGLLDLQVRTDLRRQGLARFLIAQILRYLQEQYFGILEVQTAERHQAVVNLFRGLGFEQVDVGRTYCRERVPQPIDEALTLH